MRGSSVSSSVGRWRLGLLLPLAAGGAVACSSSARPDFGGQTGSLIPGPKPELPGYELKAVEPCSFGLGAPEVAEGDVALVIYEGTGPVEEVRLVDSEGTVIEVELEDLPDGTAQLVRTEQALQSGEYSVEFECAAPSGVLTHATTLRVTPAAELPMTVGQLEALFDVDQVRGCDADAWYDLRWVPDETVLPFENLLSVSLRINDGEPFVVVPYGQVAFDDDVGLDLSLPRCPDDEHQRCLPAGAATVALLVEIAGEIDAPDEERIEFEARCSDPEPRGGESCAINSRGAKPSSGLLAYLLVLVSSVLARGRARTHRASR